MLVNCAVRGGTEGWGVTGRGRAGERGRPLHVPRLSRAGGVAGAAPGGRQGGGPGHRGVGGHRHHLLRPLLAGQRRL